MESIEFLIQKEGDRTWLPLEEPLLAIETGKYRIVAHSDRLDREVEIRIAYGGGDTKKSDRRIQKYYRRTNLQGLVMILPFTDLAPGMWELRCCNDILSELLGEFWQKTVKLQVLALEESTKELSPNPQAIHDRRDRIDEKSKQQISSPENLDSVPLDGALGIGPIVALGSFSAIVNPDEFAVVEFHEAASFKRVFAKELKLTLKQETFSRDRAESIPLAGRIEALAPQTSESVEFVVDAKLYYQIKDPQTDRTILKLEQSFTEETLPLNFYYCLDIPDNISSPALLGEVILERSDRQPLIRQSFIIHTNLTESDKEAPSAIRYTLKVSDFHKDLSETLNLLLAEESQSIACHLDLPDPAQMKGRPLCRSQAVSEPILPPKLREDRGTEKQRKSLKLPQLPQPQRFQESDRQRDRFPDRAVNTLGDAQIASVLTASSHQKENSKSDRKGSSRATPLTPLSLQERFILRLNALAEEDET